MKKFLLIITAFALLVTLNIPFLSCTSIASSTPVPSPAPAPAPAPSPTPTPAQETTPGPIASGWIPPAATGQPQLPDMSQVVAKVRPSVVAIDIEATTYDIFNQPQKVQGAGSGWIIDSAGYVVTNNHVVEGADTVTITLADGRVFPADMIKTDPFTDLAVVKINASNLIAAPRGDVTNLDIAEWVVAIGNSLGMGISATVGVVSALDVSFQESPGQTLHGLIQTDAAINPGNSGGPLVNTAGEVVGINSIKVAQVGVEGMGYAISINEAIPVIQKLIEIGYVVRPWLGINAFTMNDVVAARYGLPVNKGVLITNVAQGSPAEKANLKAGDIIASINDGEIDNISDLVDKINTYSVGQSIDITYWRGQTKSNVLLILAESPKPQ